MKRCLAVLLSALLLLTATPVVSATYNDDHFDWGEYSCPHASVEAFEEVPSTCVTNGCGAYTRCADCKMLLSGSWDHLPLSDHTYDNACDTDCNVCGEVREIAHVYDAVVTAPDCENGGYTTYTCACGDSYVADHTAALGHTSEIIEGYAPTCTATGLTDGAQCSVCGQILTAQEIIPALGHAYDAVVTAPDCENGGYTTYTCACGDSYVADHTAALGHTYEPVVTAPTCVSDGYTTHTCACGDSYEDTFVPATGEHVYDDDRDADCNVCGHVRPIVTPGDVNGDGKINNRDLGILQLYLNDSDLAGKTFHEKAADLDGNGRINNRDQGKLQQLLNN